MWRRADTYREVFSTGTLESNMIYIPTLPLCVCVYFGREGWNVNIYRIHPRSYRECTAFLLCFYLWTFRRLRAMQTTLAGLDVWIGMFFFFSVIPPIFPESTEQCIYRGRKYRSLFSSSKKKKINKYSGVVTACLLNVNIVKTAWGKKGTAITLQRTERYYLSLKWLYFAVVFIYCCNAKSGGMKRFR